MEWQPVINIGFIALVGLFGWLARELWGAVKELKEDLKDVEVALPTDYVQKNEYHRDLIEIKMMLNKISDKLDAKADKA